MTADTRLTALPLWSQRAGFHQQISRTPLLVEAEPGAGKSTLIPLWALASAPEQQQVWLVQPRILAARAVARRLAILQGDPLGKTVGYQVPFDRQLGHRADSPTRLQIMTPGIFLQRLLQDPELSGVHTVILDEMHERSVDLDLAWAWLQECLILRDALQVIVMTATPDPRLRSAVGNRLYAPGRQFPVTTRYQASEDRETLSRQVVRALLAHEAEHPTVLIFLPGWREIEQCRRTLAKLETPSGRQRTLWRLHSRTSDQEQQKALDPDTGPRIILATNLAETSLTVPDVTLVIDSGLARFPRFIQKSGVTRLHTERISQASADQRRGRAGRIAAGSCVRLWAENEHLPAAERPEITRCDALPLVMKLAHWGSPPEDLDWLDPPNSQALQGAVQQLQHWHLIDSSGQITLRGRAVSRLGTHPRVATLLLAGRDHNAGQVTTSLINLALMLHFNHELKAGSSWQAELAQARTDTRHWQQQAQRWLSVMKCTEGDQPLPQRPLLQALPDRIGHRQESGRYRLTSGISVKPINPMTAEWSCFPVVQPEGSGHRGLGIPVQLSTAEKKGCSLEESTLHWSTGSGKQKGPWQLRTRWWLGDQIVAEEQSTLTPAEAPQQLSRYLMTLPLHHFKWSDSALSLLQRARIAAQFELLQLPELSENALLQQLNQWLLPFLQADIPPSRLPWLEGLSWHLGYGNVQRLKEQLPTHWTLPSGKRCRIEYGGNLAPRIEARLQDFLGVKTLTLANGRIPVTAVLMSPAQRPLAITADLASFWIEVYPEVRKEMRGRYPKHHWPKHSQ